MRLLVCGGRDFDRRAYAIATLDGLHQRRPIDLIIHGDARGADLLGKEWAISRGVAHRAFPADWNEYGKRAGFIRNQQMLDHGNPDALLAFPGGRGTADMVRRARLAGVPILEAP